MDRFHRGDPVLCPAGSGQLCCCMARHAGLYRRQGECAVSDFSIGLLFIVGMIGLMVIWVPIAIAMILAGTGGYVVLAGWLPLLNQLKTGPFFVLSSDSFSVIPLFLLMGYIASRSGISRA